MLSREREACGNFVVRIRNEERASVVRAICFWWEAGRQFWLFTLYGKDEMEDLSAREKGLLKDMLKRELEARR